MNERTLPTDQDAWAAAQVVGVFWEALALDDDVMALQVTVNAIHDELGTEPGFAARVREALGVDSPLAARLGVSSKVRVVEGVMIFACMEIDPDEGIRRIGQWGPVMLPGWRIPVTVEAGRWRIAGRFDYPGGEWPPHTEYLDLPYAPPSNSPPQ